MSQHFIYLFRPPRRDFLQTMSDDERAIMARHVEYIVDLHSRGTILLAGPCLDGAFALCAFSAESPEAARRILDNDPAVRDGRFEAELHPFHPGFITGRTPVLLNV